MNGISSAQSSLGCMSLEAGSPVHKLKTFKSSASSTRPKKRLSQQFEIENANVKLKGDLVQLKLEN